LTRAHHTASRMPRTTAQRIRFKVLLDPTIPVFRVRNDVSMTIKCVFVLESWICNTCDFSQIFTSVSSADPRTSHLPSTFVANPLRAIALFGVANDLFSNQKKRKPARINRGYRLSSFSVQSSLIAAPGIAACTHMEFEFAKS
jgi:hypothetical protein